jgi:hypothetical protein
MEDEHKTTKSVVHPAAILGIIAVVCVFGYIAFGTRDSTDNTTATSTTAGTSQTTAPTIPPISLSQIQISDLQLSCTFANGVDGTGYFPDCGQAGFKLKGQVTNNSNTSFEGINITVNAYNCPGSTISSNCSHVGQTTWPELLVDDGGTGGSFPPNQVREAVAVAVNLSGMPPIHGNFLWSYSVTGFYNGFEEIPVTK